MAADKPTDLHQTSVLSARTPPAPDRPVIGDFVEGIDIPVVNERAVRASAGLLFLGGIIAFMVAALTGDYQPLRMFGAIFMFDLAFRLFVGTRYTPSLIVGWLLVRAQRPEWVGAAQKKLAWSIGLAMAFISCGVMGFLNLSSGITLALCSICLSMLFIESALGICLGCELQRAFSKQKPQLCAGDTCTYEPPTRVSTSDSAVRRRTGADQRPIG